MNQKVITQKLLADAARQHALDALGEEQFKTNRNAVQSVKTSFLEGANFVLTTLEAAANAEKVEPFRDGYCYSVIIRNGEAQRACFKWPKSVSSSTIARKLREHDERISAFWTLWHDMWDIAGEDHRPPTKNEPVEQLMKDARAGDYPEIVLTFTKKEDFR